MPHPPPTQRFVRPLRWIGTMTLVLLLGGMALLWWSPRWILRPLRWLERKHFAYVGDQGPLQIVHAGRWEPIYPKMWKRRMHFRRKAHRSAIYLRLVRLDPAVYRIALWYGIPRRIGWMMKNTDALVAINAGLFDPQRRPLGLFKQNGKLLNARLHKRSIDGVFSISHNLRPQILPGRGFSHRNSRDAFQSSPLLVFQSKRHPLRKQSWKVDRRSALCLDEAGYLLLMATEGYFNGLSYGEMSQLMSRPAHQGGLQCRSGLNLDGGGSVQWAVRTQTKRWEAIQGMDATPLYLLIRSRK
ncbi:phosphodiester glycosidase family protein [Myxococcota bacterium]|nr:phosphodiester glycosidase family protein [Myxococcota bacterium]